MLKNLTIPLSPWTYARLDYKHFFWSVFYFGIYFYIGLQIYQFLGFYVVEYGGQLAEVAFRKLDKCLSFVDELDRLSNHTLTEDKRAEYLASCNKYPSQTSGSVNLVLAQLVFGGIGGLLIFLGYSILINPYLWLLRSAVKIPTKRMHKIDCSSAANLIALIAGRKGKKSILYKGQIAQLDHSITGLENEVRMQDLRAASAAPKYVETLRAERGTVYQKMLDAASLRSVLENPSFPSEFRDHIATLADRIDKLSMTARKQSA